MDKVKRSFGSVILFSVAPIIVLLGVGLALRQLLPQVRFEIVLVILFFALWFEGITRHLQNTGFVWPLVSKSRMSKIFFGIGLFFLMFLESVAAHYVNYWFFSVLLIGFAIGLFLIFYRLSRKAGPSRLDK